MKTKVNISDFKNFDNRELSWLKFEQRVLNEATNKELPILERLKFVSITSSNLDEFFMVRVASLKDMEHAGYTKPDIAGMTPTEQLVLINEKTRELVDFQYSTFSRSLMPILKEKGILIYDKYEDLNAEQLKYVDSFFMSQVYPVLTPMAFDASRPFPLIRNKSLNIAALIEKKKDALVAGSNNDDVEFATVQVPSVLPRFISLPSDEGKHDCFILLEQIIERNMDKLFLNYNVVAASPYRIMRNADFSIDEEYYENSDYEQWLESENYYDDEEGKYFVIGDSFEEYRSSLPPIRGIDHCGEVSEFMLIMGLNDLGKSFLTVDRYTSMSRPYSNVKSYKTTC